MLKPAYSKTPKKRLCRLTTDTLAEKTAFFLQSRNPLTYNGLHKPLIPHHSSLIPETYMFRSRKLSFHLPKDRLLACKRPCFATRNIYVWEWKGSKKGSEKGVKGRKIGRFSVFQRCFYEIEMLKTVPDFKLFSQFSAYTKKRIMFFALPLQNK